MNILFGFLQSSFLILIIFSSVVYGLIPEKNLTSLLAIIFFYVVFGFVVLVRIPDVFTKRLQSRLTTFTENKGFKANWEIRHKSDRLYLGFDDTQKKFLLIDQISKKEILFDSNDVNMWEIEQKDNRNFVVRFLTDLSNNPVIEMVIHHSNADTIRSRMYSVFGV